jgi:hypothetical protein
MIGTGELIRSIGDVGRHVRHGVFMRVPPRCDWPERRR